METKILIALIGGAVSIVTALLAMLRTFTSDRRNRAAKLELQASGAKSDDRIRELEHAHAFQKSELDARRAYEYEARKRLYDEYQPLVFQLMEHAENAQRRILGMVQMMRLGNINATDGGWLAGDSYYLYSTVHSLLAPIAVFRTIQRRLTSFDLTVDPNIEGIYRLTKILYFSFSAHFDLAALEPSLPYSPYSKSSPDPLQGVPRGVLDMAVDSVIITGPHDRERVMNYGEFERAYGKKSSTTHQDCAAVVELVRGFHASRRPVLWRLLMTQAHLYATLLRSARHGAPRMTELARMKPEQLAWGDPAKGEASYDLAQAYYKAELAKIAELTGIAPTV